MNGHLARLAVRATRPTSGGLRPRVPALFESSLEPPPGVGATAVDRPAEVDPGGPPAVTSPPPGRAVVDPASRTGPSEASGLQGDKTPEAAPQDTDDDARRVRRSRPRRAPAPVGAPETEPPTSQASPAGPSPDPPSSLRSHAPDRPSPRSTPPRSAVPGPVVASPVAAAVGASLLPAPADRVRPGADDPQARPDDAAPAAGPPASAPSPAVRLRWPLPGLRTASRGDRAPGSPEVTVTIGRIEVVPPRPETPTPPTRRPRPHPRASSAPPLADYLRDRSRR